MDNEPIISMENSPSRENNEDIFAEEMIHYFLLKDFGIFWVPISQGPESRNFSLPDFYPPYKLFGEAVCLAWKYHYKAVAEETSIIWKDFESSACGEEYYYSLKAVARNNPMQHDHVFFVTMAVFGDLCVRICRHGGQSEILNAVSGAKRFILGEHIANKNSLHERSLKFIKDEVLRIAMDRASRNPNQPTNQ